METNNEAAEENPLTKSSRSLVQISSIYINLPAIPMQINEIGSCHHNFSIRGYTVEKRRSNQNASVLFPSDGDYVEQLPPMEVPKFRWWRCSECSKEFDSSGNATMGLPGTQPSMANADAIAVDANTVEGASSLSSPQKIKNARSGDVAAMGVINESSEQAKVAVANNRDEEINSIIEDVIPGGHDHESAPQTSTDADDVSVPSELQKSAESSEHVIASETTNIAAVEHRVDGFSGKLDASETDQCRENEQSTAVQRRKIKKVRLLTDLLGEKSSSKGVNPCPKSVPFESAGLRNAGSEVQSDPCKDVPNNLQSPLRKSKVTREEEESNGPSNIGTNIRAPRRDNGKAILVADVPDSEAEVNAFAAEGLFIGTKTERSRRRSDSTPALGRKKSKQSQVLDFATTLPSLTGSLQPPSAVGSWENCQSPRQTDQNHADFIPGALKSLPSDNTFAKTALDLSLNSFVKRIDSISQSSASKGSAKKDGMPFGGSITVPAMESDASRRKLPLWDLNERAAQKETDFLQLGLNEKNSEVQGNLKESDQIADDIPMEIVELLAKKQYERRNGDIVKSSLAHVTGNTSRRSLEVEEIRTVEQFAKEFPNFPDFRSFNARNGISTPVNSMGAARQNSANLLHVGRSHLNQPKSIYTAFAQNQPKLQSGVHIPATDSTRPVLQCSDAVEPLFSSSSSKMPFGLAIQHNLAAEQHKGKTISDIKADELRRTEEARLNFPKPGDSMVSTKGKQALDPYANESIPAMQLLNLMDGRSPGVAFNLGPSKILDKPLTPCSFHPRFSTNERQDFLNGSFFSRQRHPETSGLVLDSYQSSRQLSAILSGQISFKPPEQEKSKEKSQKTVLGSGAGPSSSRGKDKQKAHNPSDSILFPPKHQTLAGSRRFNLEGHGVYGGVRPVRSVSSEGECGMNQNPADFSIPEAGNIYTFCARDIKFRRRNASRERHPSVKANGVKRQRVTQAKPGNENA